MNAKPKGISYPASVQKFHNLISVLQVHRIVPADFWPTAIDPGRVETISRLDDGGAIKKRVLTATWTAPIKEKRGSLTVTLCGWFVRNEHGRKYEESNMASWHVVELVVKDEHDETKCHLRCPGVRHLQPSIDWFIAKLRHSAGLI